MLVIHRRGSSLGRMGRYYRGSGIFDAHKAHKVADAVVNGATSSTSKKVVDAIVKEATSAAAGKASASTVKTATDSVVNKVVKSVKRPADAHVHQQPSLAKRMKINIDSLIDGSGIVYD